MTIVVTGAAGFIEGGGSVRVGGLTGAVGRGGASVIVASTTGGAITVGGSIAGIVIVVVADSNASTISPAVAKRSSGFLASAFKITRSTDSGNEGLIARGMGRGSLICLITIPIGVSAS